VRSRNWYPGCGTVEAVHLLVGVYLGENDYFDIIRLDGEGYEPFQPSQTALKEAIRQVMPAKNDGRAKCSSAERLLPCSRAPGNCRFRLRQSAHLFLALLLRKDMQAVLKKAGYGAQDLLT